MRFACGVAEERRQSRRLLIVVVDTITIMNKYCISERKIIYYIRCILILLLLKYT
jgi:hypothetical protein